VALVTGATRGIGQGIAVELAKQGLTVVGTATTEEGAERISQSLQERGLSGRGAVLDVTSAAAVDTLLKDIQAQLGAVAVLVNNAGVTRDNLLMRLKEPDWDAVLDTNLKAVYRLSRGVLRPMMKARFGRIINIGSVVGTLGNAGQCNYAAAKAGLEGLGRSLAREVANRGITVNTVAPGFIDTDMTRGLAEDQRQTLIAQVPVSRLGTAEDVAHAVAFLASDGASYITGITLHVNGGMLMS
jgi:3-oxoacyl-[acyl-carrier protein] reductase